MERGAQIETKAPFDLAKRLAHLHHELPEPLIPEALGDAKPNISWSLSADIWEACHAYEQALRAMTAPTSPLDDRLRAVYGRLHIQAIKIAILLSALDWADADKPSKQPKVSREH